MTTAKFSSGLADSAGLTFSRLIEPVLGSLISSFDDSHTETLEVLTEAVTHLKNSEKECGSV